MFRRFGSEVTIIEMGSRLVGHEDEDVSAAVLEIVEREGIEVRLNASNASDFLEGAGRDSGAGGV